MTPADCHRPLASVTFSNTSATIKVDRRLLIIAKAGGGHNVSVDDSDRTGMFTGDGEGEPNAQLHMMHRLPDGGQPRRPADQQAGVW